MIVQRFTFTVKPGGMDEAIRLLKDMAAQNRLDMRIQTAEFGPFDELVLDLRWENQAAPEAFWAEWFATPESGDFFQQYDPLWAGPGKNELWNVVDPEVPLSGGEPVRLINRRTFPIKPGQIGHAVELLVDQQNRAERGADIRILTAAIGPFNTLVMDVEFSSFEHYFRAWEQWGEQADTPAFFEAWAKMVGPGGTNEVWTVR